MRHGLLTWVGVLSACSAGAPVGSYLGSDHYTAETTRVEAPPPGPPKPAPWARLAEALAWPAVYVAESAHGPGPPWATVRVNPEFTAAYKQWTRGMTAPSGTVALQELRQTPEGPVRELLVMERDAAGWHFIQLDPSGLAQGETAQNKPSAASPGDGLRPAEASPLCQSCHTQATSDSLFGPARDAHEAYTGPEPPQ